MVALSWHLRRFWRLVSPPGRAGPAGVPADLSASLRDELAVVLESIDAVQEQAERSGNDAAAVARKRLDEADARAKRILADARHRAEQERAQARAQRRGDIRADTEARLAAARQQADAIRARSDAVLGGLADRIVDRLLEAEIREADPWP